MTLQVQQKRIHFISIAVIVVIAEWAISDWRWTLQFQFQLKYSTLWLVILRYSITYYSALPVKYSDWLFIFDLVFLLLSFFYITFRLHLMWEIKITSLGFKKFLMCFFQQLIYYHAQLLRNCPISYAIFVKYF